MSAIGLNTNIVKLIRTGGKPLGLGFCCWVGIAGMSLLMQHILGALVSDGTEDRPDVSLLSGCPWGRPSGGRSSPSIASQMVILLYNLADTYFVGLLNDAAQTAAVSLAYSVTLLMTALANLSPWAAWGASPSSSAAATVTARGRSVR